MTAQTRDPTTSILPRDFFERPLLVMTGGTSRSGKYRLSRDVWFEVPGRFANTVIALEEARRRDRAQLPDDRGWASPERLKELFKSVIGKTVEKTTTEAYLYRTFQFMRKRYASLGILHLFPFAKEHGRGLHLTSPIDITDITGRLDLSPADGLDLSREEGLDLGPADGLDLSREEGLDLGPTDGLDLSPKTVSISAAKKAESGA